MTLVLRHQDEIFEKYCNNLSIEKNNIILKILTHFSNNKLYGKNEEVGWLENQIIFYLDKYGFNENFKKQRKEYTKKLENKFYTSEYKFLSLDNIVLELFTWTVEELKGFYDVQKKCHKNKIDCDKSVYDLGIRKNVQNGGGYNRKYLLYYIDSLSNKKNFKLLIHIFNKIYEIKELEIEKIIKFLLDKDISELYYSEYADFIVIEKFFLYLLNRDIEPIINRLSYCNLKINKKNIVNIINFPKTYYKLDELDNIYKFNNKWKIFYLEYPKYNLYTYYIYRKYNDNIYKNIMEYKIINNKNIIINLTIVIEKLGISYKIYRVNDNEINKINFYGPKKIKRKRAIIKDLLYIKNEFINDFIKNKDIIQRCKLKIFSNNTDKIIYKKIFYC